MATVDSVSTEIDGEIYSLLAVPDVTSGLVLASRTGLEGDLHLEVLVHELSLVGGFIRIAYNAVAAARPDPKITGLQNKIQRLGFDITGLCSESAVTVASFKSATQTILQELKAAYEYLLDGFDDMAVNSVSEVSTLAKTMAEAADKLQTQFKAEANAVQSAVEETTTQKSKEEKSLEEAKKKHEQLEQKQKNLGDKIDQLKKDEAAAKADKEGYQKMSDDTMSQYGREMAIFLNGDESIMVKTALLPVVAAKTVVAGISYLIDASKAKQKLEEEKDYRRQRQESIDQRTEFLRQMKDLNFAKTDYKNAATFLHQACGSLKKLSVVMKRASEFWMKLHRRCQSLANDGIQRRIETAMKYPEEKRMELWRKPTFIRQGVTYYAKWVALDQMCDEYMGHIKTTQEDLYRYVGLLAATRQQNYRTGIASYQI